MCFLWGCDRFLTRSWQWRSKVFEHAYVCTCVLVCVCVRVCMCVCLCVYVRMHMFWWRSKVYLYMCVDSQFKGYNHSRWGRMEKSTDLTGSRRLFAYMSGPGSGEERRDAFCSSIQPS